MCVFDPHHKIGSIWLSLQEEERGVYMRMYEEAVSDSDALHAQYDDVLLQWRQGKRERGGEGEGGRVCNCAYCTG